MKIINFDPGNPSLTLCVVWLAAARVGRMPYPWQPDEENRAWLERYFAAIQDVIDEDICTNLNVVSPPTISDKSTLIGTNASMIIIDDPLTEDAS